MAKRKKNKKENNQKKEVEQQSRQITRFNIIFINVQLFLTFFTIGLFVWYLFDSSVLYFFQLFLGITLLVMAYNNQIIYRRKKMTICYSIVGLFLLILDLLLYLAVSGV